MRLYYSPGASSLAPHIALREAGIAFDLVRVDLERGILPHTGQAFASMSPMAKVPALELDDGAILSEGLAVLTWIADLAPVGSLAPAPGTLARARMLEHMSFTATELHKGFSPLFDAATPPAYKQHLAGDLRPLQRMAAWLVDGPYLQGAGFTVADAHLFAILRLGLHAGIDLSRWPHVGEYVARVAARPCVRDAIQAEGLVAA
jgi:glutathione S-transferase